MADGADPSRSTDELMLAVGRMFPRGTSVAVVLADPARRPENPVEAEAVARMVPARREEFLAGRAALRQAIGDQGVTCGAIAVGPHRDPVLPDVVAASLSHCEGLCIAVASRKATSLGFDLDLARPLPEDLWTTVLTPEDRRHLAKLPEGRRGIAAMQVFSCKEAFYKAQYPLTGHILDFSAVDIEIEGTSFSLRLRETVGPFPAGRILRGALATVSGLILSGLTVED